MLKFRFGLLIAMLTVGSVTPTIAGQLTVHGAIAPYCNDVAGNPYCSISAAIKYAMDGDRIAVQPGRYMENIDFKGKAIDLYSTQGAEKTRIQGQGATVVTLGPSARLSGFTIRNKKGTHGSGIRVMGRENFISANIVEYVVHSTGTMGAGIGGDNAQAVIEGNIFRRINCKSNYHSAVVKFVNSSGLQIKNNVIENNLCNALHMELLDLGKAEVVNNTIVSNRIGVYIDRKYSTSAQFYLNNIVYNNDIGLQISGRSNTNIPAWDNNLVYGNGINYRGIKELTGKYGNISVDPQFADLGTQDYRLRAHSAAIDAGIRLNAPSKDFLDNARPIDGDHDRIAAVDMGAFEASPPRIRMNTEVSAIAGQHVALNADISDSDGIIRQVKWEKIQGPDVSFMANDTRALDFVAPTAPGLITLRLTVRDDLDFMRSKAVNISVNSRKKIPKRRHKKIKKSTHDILKENDLQPQFAALKRAVRKVLLAHKLPIISKSANKPPVENRTLGESSNIAPRVQMGADFTVRAGDISSVNGSFSTDPDGEIIKYAWQQIGGAPVQLTQHNSDIVVFTAPNEPTTLVFELTVMDNDGALAKDIISVRVTSFATKLDKY